MRNERLLKLDENENKQKWKKGYIKALDSKKRKQFFEFKTICRFRGIKLFFVDNMAEYNEQPLLTFCLKYLDCHLENRGFEALNKYRMENMF